MKRLNDRQYGIEADGSIQSAPSDQVVVKWRRDAELELMANS
ncbi:hypothetical protein Pcac1_g15078 [Phytophthora cactorum]|uniref:Uncharacterized protein n=1 Tax=Phytophthora cactorum TaxID=29920 RepID=A0A8T1D206_9STRA|nr:hypothetical protein Pcac1_g15078 [Phytophthora cactorum]KAG2891788.1 hypothetical protein PC114_g16881 [Phytophthora cactorum]KAG2931532.1 hypothetical protein PC117_g13427 [Phytophthora cactorum]KAG3007597.1 hypothetical protein PC120_g16742 [Phytophthora cactorum]KAG3011744.1 hypothetical protein PC119_g13111 [Phytophthora cactorum]